MRGRRSVASTVDQRRKVAALKSASSGLKIIDVVSDTGQVLGSLQAITADDLKDDILLNRLCEWRRSAKHGFLTVFEPSAESTLYYLENISLPDPGRILFIVRDASSRPIGNIGLCNIAAGEAELDNVLRGEPAPAPLFMKYVIEAVLKFAFEDLGVQKVVLNVLSGNDSAIKSYLRVGFEVVRTQKLLRTDTDDGFKLTPSGEPWKDGEGLPGLVLMQIDDASFRQRTHAAA